MNRRLTLLTWRAYYQVRLRRACARQKTGLVFLGLGLLLATGFWLRPRGPSDQAAEPPPPATWPVSTVVRPLVGATPKVVTDTAVPTPTPTLLPALPPTAHPIPTTGLVWGGNVTGVYLWQAPEGQILTRLANGTAVKLGTERASYGNLPWIKVHTPCGTGWLLLTQVFRQTQPPTAYIALRTGTYLRDRPRGRAQQLLSLGTPLMQILTRQETGGRTWVQVEVVNGAVGWVPADGLAGELPRSGC